MDLLVERGADLQRAVFFGTASLLNLELDLLFLDTTTVYVEIEEEDEKGLRRIGHARDHRPTTQVVGALVLTCGGSRCGWSVWSGMGPDLIRTDQRVLAGNTASGRQRAALKRGGGHAIVGQKLRAGSQEAEVMLSRRPGRYRRVRDNLEVKEATIARGSERRRFVLVCNPGQAARNRASARSYSDGWRPPGSTG